MTLVEKIERQMAAQTVALLLAYAAASRIKIEWGEDKHPEVVYTPVVALQYIEVSFTVT